MPVADTSTAPEREAAFLANTGDGLPELLAVNGGPWQIIQPRWSRTPPGRKTRIYVLRSETDDDRTANQRIVPTYDFQLRLYWPAALGTGQAEAAQVAFDRAIELLLRRIRGFPADKSHGGRFQSVGENPRRVRVVYDDPEKTLTDGAELTARATYSADDFEIDN